MPSLSEITNIRGDKNVAFGSGGNPNLSQDEVVGLDLSQLSNAALSQEKQNLQTMLWHREDVKNIFDRSKDMAVDVSKLNQADAKYIMDSNNALQKKIAENLDVIADPTINPKLFAELKSEKEKLAGLADKSRIDGQIKGSYSKMLESNPSWATQENKSIIEAYDKAPIEERKYMELIPPSIIDYGTFATKGNEIAKQETDKIIDQNGLIATDKQTEYELNAYTNWAEQNFENGADAFGRPIKEVTMKVYGTNEVDAKKKYMDTMLALRKGKSNDVSNLGSNQLTITRENNAASIKRAQIDSYTEIEKAKQSGNKTPTDAPIHENAIMLANIVAKKIGSEQEVKIGGKPKKLQVFDLAVPVRLGDVNSVGGVDTSPKAKRIAYDKETNKIYYVSERQYLSPKNGAGVDDFELMDDVSMYTMIDKAPYATSTDKRRVPEQEKTRQALVDNGIYRDGVFDASRFATLVDGVAPKVASSDNKVLDDKEYQALKSQIK